MEMDDLTICNKLRDLGYRPYFPVVVDGELLEAISYPYPDHGEIYIMVREVGQPETVRPCRVPDFAKDFI